VREFMTAETQVVGLPRLRPGQFVDIHGLRPPFDGYYYVTKTVHALDGSGYKTQLSLRRPGMMPPDRYLPESVASDAGGSP
jgi:phage protein D